MFFSIREYGRIEGLIKDAAATAGATQSTPALTGSDACTLTGDEFNPLRETDKMGRANPYQDKTRGRLAMYQLIKTGTGVVGSGAAAVINKNVLINLSGPDSVMGRSIVAFLDNGSATTPYTHAGNQEMASSTELAAEAHGCCVIGYDTPPDLASSTHHHHGPGTVAHTHANN